MRVLTTTNDYKYVFTNESLYAHSPVCSSPPRPGVSACNGKHYLPPSCVNYVGQDGNALLPPFDQTHPVNTREKRDIKSATTKSHPRFRDAFDRGGVAHHDLPVVKPRRRKDGHHGSRSSNGATLANGKAKYSHTCSICVHFFKI